MALKLFRPDDNKVFDNGSYKTNETVMNSSKKNKSRNFIYISNIKATRKPIFLTSNTKKTFNYLK